MDYIQCPFCKETDFDLMGLKLHLEMKWCEPYNEIRTSAHRDHRKPEQCRHWDVDTNRRLMEASPNWLYLQCNAQECGRTMILKRVCPCAAFEKEEKK